jgi:uncharacterized Zn finger protein
VLVRCENGELVATVRGDHADYDVVLDERGRPVCPCPSWRRDCSHSIAVALITGGRP